MKTEFVSLNGNSFFVRRWGNPSLPPLLLLHGFPEYGGLGPTLPPSFRIGFTASLRISAVLGRAGLRMVSKTIPLRHWSGIWRN